MTHPIAIARHVSRRIIPVVALLFLALLFVGGTHHHSDGGGHVCVVCSIGHAPVVEAQLTALATNLSAPTRRLIAPSPVAPRQARSETASSRAPPLA